MAVNLEGDTDLEDEPPIPSEGRFSEDRDVQREKPYNAEGQTHHFGGTKKEEDALSALNSVLDILCKSKQENTKNQNEFEDECEHEGDLEATYKGLYENLEELSSGESSIPNDADSNDAMIEDLLEAASEVSSGEDEMLKRNETILEHSAEMKVERSFDNNGKEVSVKSIFFSLYGVAGEHYNYLISSDVITLVVCATNILSLKVKKACIFVSHLIMY